jgi:acetyl-CoA carboxylase biotin carboxyl carrier protein
MDIRKVKKLIQLLEESGLSEIEITEGEDTVRITREVSKDSIKTEVVTSQPQQETPDNSQTKAIKQLDNGDLHKITAPMIGTFYHASEQNVEAFVKVGDQVSGGDTLCIIEAMKMMNQIASDANGIIERILVQNGDPVEYDQVLFLINPN